MGDRTVTATLNNSEAARDLVAIAPVCPSTCVTTCGARRPAVFPGRCRRQYRGEPDLRVRRLGAQWRPGGGFVIFYRRWADDSLAGIVLLGKVDSGADIFDVPGTVDVTVELINWSTSWKSAASAWRSWGAPWWRPATAAFRMPTSPDTP